MRFAAAFVALCLTALPVSAQADMFSPSHYCRKPIKPYEFTDEWQISRFKNELQRYKDCISDFVEEQNDAARKHQEAADEAIEEWNSYVRNELG
jgi:hypothetical protein